MSTFIWSVVAGVVLLVSTGGARAQGGPEQSQSTAHYKIVLEIGPVTTMLMPDQAAGATE